VEALRFYGWERLLGKPALYTFHRWENDKSGDGSAPLQSVSVEPLHLSVS